MWLFITIAFTGCLTTVRPSFLERTWHLIMALIASSPIKDHSRMSHSVRLALPEIAKNWRNYTDGITARIVPDGTGDSFQVVRYLALISDQTV